MKFKKEFVLISVIGFYLVLFVVVLFNSLPYNPLKSDHETTMSIKTMFPEGWAFFTRNPREEQLFLYRYDSIKKTIKPIELLTNAHYSNFMGLSKNSRYRRVELAKIITKVSDEDWITVSKLDEITDSNNKIINIKYTHPIKTFEGVYVFVLQKPLPWAWREFKTKTEMPLKIVFINVFR